MNKLTYTFVFEELEGETCKITITARNECDTVTPPVDESGTYEYEICILAASLATVSLDNVRNYVRNHFEEEKKREAELN